MKPKVLERRQYKGYKIKIIECSEGIFGQIIKDGKILAVTPYRNEEVSTLEIAKGEIDGRFSNK